MPGDPIGGCKLAVQHLQAAKDPLATSLTEGICDQSGGVLTAFVTEKCPSVMDSRGNDGLVANCFELAANKSDFVDLLKPSAPPPPPPPPPPPVINPRTTTISQLVELYKQPSHQAEAVGELESRLQNLDITLSGIGSVLTVFRNVAAGSDTMTNLTRVIAAAPKNNANATDLEKKVSAMVAQYRGGDIADASDALDSLLIDQKINSAGERKRLWDYVKDGKAKEIVDALTSSIVTGVISTMHGYVEDHGYATQNVFDIGLKIPVFDRTIDKLTITPELLMLFLQLPAKFGDTNGWLVPLDKSGKLFTFGQIDVTAQYEYNKEDSGSVSFKLGYGDEDPLSLVPYGIKINQGMKPFSGAVKNAPVADLGWGAEAKWTHTFLKLAGWNIKPFAALRYDFACNPVFDLADFDSDGVHYKDGDQMCLNLLAGATFTVYPKHVRLMLEGHLQHSTPDVKASTTAMGVHVGFRAALFGAMGNDDAYGVTPQLNTSDPGALFLDGRFRYYGGDYDQYNLNVRAEYYVPGLRGGLGVYAAYGLMHSTSAKTVFANTTPSGEAGAQDTTGSGKNSGDLSSTIDQTANEVDFGLKIDPALLAGSKKSYGTIDLGGGLLSTERVEQDASGERDPTNKDRWFVRAAYDAKF